MQVPPNIDDVCDALITYVHKAGEGASLNRLKLQKLLYYLQAWHLALHGKPLFDGKFEAWVHGPVNRGIYSRFAGDHMYANITLADRRKDSEFTIDELSRIQPILDEYVPFSGTDMRRMTHIETPWLKAREGLDEFEKCTTPIDENLMADFYRAQGS